MHSASAMTGSITRIAGITRPSWSAMAEAGGALRERRAIS
jgi:hypothetical protein